MIDLNNAGDTKSTILKGKIHDASEFKKKIEDYKIYSQKKEAEIAPPPTLKLSEFRAKGKLHGINRESLSEMVTKGKLGRFNFDAVPFHQKRNSEKLKAIDAVIENCIPLDIRDTGQSRSVRRISVHVSKSDIKSMACYLSSNLLLDKQSKMIRKLRQMTDNTSHDVSRSFSPSRLHTENNNEQNRVSIKESFVQKKIIIHSKISNKSSIFWPELSRGPTEDINNDDLGGPKYSSRTIPNQIKSSRFDIDKQAKKIVDKDALNMQPDVLQKKLSPKFQMNELPKIDSRRYFKVRFDSSSARHL